MLKISLAAGAFALLISSSAFADDVWVNQCILDNTKEDQGQSSEVLMKYCTCMDGKIPEGETRSVTEWEKTHETEEVACETEAGWQ